MNQLNNQIVVQTTSGRAYRIQNNGNNLGAVLQEPGGLAIELVGLGNVKVVAGMTRKMVYWGHTEQVEIGSALIELFKGNRRAFTLESLTYEWTVQGSIVHLQRSEGGPAAAVITRGQGFTSAVNSDQGMVHWTCVVIAAVLEASGWLGL
ncbi:hypothetical protein C8J56DRAFT_1166302 [Mycena floridula]|nr:hypothetical protein C8J56DRAFT_1166302 [Mycena floridula]